jgi:hypothetical protein
MYTLSHVWKQSALPLMMAIWMDETRLVLTNIVFKSCWLVR